MPTYQCSMQVCNLVSVVCYTNIVVITMLHGISLGYCWWPEIGSYFGPPTPDGRIDTYWGLVLKCYESRTRQHKMLNVNALRPSKHYLL
jgi:hypothetical protein